MTDPIQIPGATRVEVIDTTGRAFVAYYEPGVEIHVQDDARTVKVFAGDRKARAGASRPAPTDASEDRGATASCHPCVGAGGYEDYDGEWVECSCQRAAPAPIEAGEREALAAVLRDNVIAAGGGRAFDAADVILAAGFRRAPTEDAEPLAFDPKGGCVCIPHEQDAGGGHTERLLEYQTDCPEHSEHLYDPRQGAWVHRPAPIEVTDEMVFAAGNQIWNRGWQVPLEVLRFGIEAAFKEMENQ